MSPRYLLVILALTGCATLNPARPLDRGEHAVGATFGGPALVFAGLPVPMPNLVLEGRSGLPLLANRPFDINYGVNLTAAAFGIAGVHGGASWMVIPQQGGAPAVTISDRQYLSTNILDLRKDVPGFSAINQLEATASWKLNQTLLFGGVAEYIDFSQPSLLLTPFVGAQFSVRDRWTLQVEARHYAINRSNAFDSIQWVTYGPGAIGVNFGFSYTLGEPR